MQDQDHINNDFINRTREIIEEKLSDERFGVSELAREAGMSRSSLLRRIRKHTTLSASQYIRQVRLERAMELLRQTSLNVSEVSYRVGFGSTSYFIRCFREYYGYPPGEAGSRDKNDTDASQDGQTGRKRLMTVLVPAVMILLLATILIVITDPFVKRGNDIEKSIAVLPFKNDSNDSSNLYIINGLMESILDNLQQIEDLRVVSRTSVEKYRNNPGTIPEIARELDVNYLVEGSGQKIGDQIFLHVQLIEAPGDDHLWVEQYRREAKDIFRLQMEVARSIADEIKAIITPDEEERISKAPTDDLVAYDLFLKGLDRLYAGMATGNRNSYHEAITEFNKAVERDNEFARAYADVAIAYYLLDAGRAEKQYTDQINTYADNALLYDSKLAQSLIAKAFYYINTKEYELAAPYLEKALEYNPNSALVINHLSDFYASYLPDTEKYLEYALRGIRLDIAANDSLDASFIFLHVSNALLQSGFISEAERYIKRSLDYYPANLWSEYVRAYILFARDNDLQRTRDLLVEAFGKDSTRIDILKDIGQICYYMRDYERAYYYYKKLTDIREFLNLDVYPGENAKIGLVFAERGMTEEAQNIFAWYKEYAENDRSVFKHLSLAVYYSYMGERDKALENLELFAQQDNYPYLVIPLLKIDPLVDNIRDLPEFTGIMDDMETRFWNRHERIKSILEEKGLI